MLSLNIGLFPYTTGVSCHKLVGFRCSHTNLLYNNFGGKTQEKKHTGNHSLSCHDEPYTMTVAVWPGEEVVAARTSWTGDYIPIPSHYAVMLPCLIVVQCINCCD